MDSGFIDAIALAVVDRLRPLLTTPAIRPRLLTVEQTAVYLGRSEKAVYNLASRGAFPSVKTDARVMFDIQDLDKWIALNKMERG